MRVAGCLFVLFGFLLACAIAALCIPSAWASWSDALDLLPNSEVLTVTEVQSTLAVERDTFLTFAWSILVAAALMLVGALLIDTQLRRERERKGS
jgi:hypothetical protein